MDMEIPYRSYICRFILEEYPNKEAFGEALNQKEVLLRTSDEWMVISSEFGKIKKNYIHIYDMLIFVNDSYHTKSVLGEADVPSLGEINVLCFVFRELYQPLISQFPDFKTFYKLARKFKYDRNKLDHPMCKILDVADMEPVLTFTDILCQTLDESFFWVKPVPVIRKEWETLHNGKIDIPIRINNVEAMPFPDMRIVCRTSEIEQIKQFVYGKPGAFRKQSSYCVFGYGGLGKTALVLEAIKEIIQDLLDGVTVNGYVPDFLLFYTAKERKISYSRTAGNIISVDVRQSFSTFDGLKTQIFSDLGIDSFAQFEKKGLIVVDNLETLSNEDRELLHDFIQAGSPPQIQYILTSRKEEHYDVSVELHGFEQEAGATFVLEYAQENDLSIELNKCDIENLLKLSRGNTLVLVLCLRRLAQNLATIDSMSADFSKLPKVKAIHDEFENLPPSGFEIISEFMFKNTFEEIEAVFSKDSINIYRILQVFAVNEGGSIDIYTLSLVTDLEYRAIEQILSILCHYLILERHGASYSQNQFAAKYIVQRFLPDSVQYMKLQDEIVNSTRRIKRELEEFDEGLQNVPERKKIFSEWEVTITGDKIAAAKADQIYRSVKEDCRKGNKFFVQTALRDAIDRFEKLERTTMHPYISYQKARVLKMIDDSEILEQRHDEEITQIYKEVIWNIKVNGVYGKIQETKTYASILWIYGMRLTGKDDTMAARYLEDAKECFEHLSITDYEYYFCLIELEKAYINLYEKIKDKTYLRQARQIDNIICRANKRTAHYWEIHNVLCRYGKF